MFRNPLRRWRRVFTAVALLGTGLAVTPSASAQDGSGGWKIGVAPYLWMASLKGTVGTLPPANPVEVDAGFGDILRNLDIGFMFYGTVRKGRWGFDIDLFYTKLEGSGSSARGFFTGDVDQSTFFVTPGVVYRVYDFKQYFIELFAGARIWSVDTDFTLRGPKRTFKASYTETWVDPMIGIQGRINIGTSNFYANGWARVGGFGVGSRITYEFFGGLGYEIKKWVSVFVGYRHLYVNRRDGGFVFDAAFTGPVMGAVFRFSLGK